MDNKAVGKRRGYKNWIGLDTLDKGGYIIMRTLLQCKQ